MEDWTLPKISYKLWVTITTYTVQFKPQPNSSLSLSFVVRTNTELMLSGQKTTYPNIRLIYFCLARIVFGNPWKQLKIGEAEKAGRTSGLVFKCSPYICLEQSERWCCGLQDLSWHCGTLYHILWSLCFLCDVPSSADWSQLSGDPAKCPLPRSTVEAHSLPQSDYVRAVRRIQRSINPAAFISASLKKSMS